MLKRIEWVDHNLNLWWGCSRVNSGCQNCTAIDTGKRLLGENIFDIDLPRREVKTFMSDLKQIDRIAFKKGETPIVLVGSMMDIFEESHLVIDSDKKPVFADMMQTKRKTTEDIRNTFFEAVKNGRFNNVVFLLLTKRPENITKMIPKEWKKELPANVWIGSSGSTQKDVQRIVTRLSKVKGNTFLCIEPQLEEVSILNMSSIESIKYVYNSAEVGHNRREFTVEWAKKLQTECKALSIKYFYKPIDVRVNNLFQLNQERITDK